MFAVKRLAIFSKLRSERITQEGHFWTCETHGDMKDEELVPYYMVYHSGYIAKDPTWNCPKCLEAWLDGDIQPARPKVSLCAKCGCADDITDCTMCGDPACAFHSMNGVCDECDKACSGQCGA
jgi:hypothetical protein